QRAPSRPPHSGLGRTRAQSSSGKTGVQLLRGRARLLSHPSRPHFTAASFCDRSANCGTTRDGPPRLRGTRGKPSPLPGELREGEAASAFLKRVQGELLTAQDHAIFTMVSLLEDLHPIAPALGISPISTGLTNVKKFNPNDLPQSGFTVDYDANPKGYESFELYLNAVETEDNLELHCHYDIKLFEDLTIREWLATLGCIF